MSFFSRLDDSPVTEEQFDCMPRWLKKRVLSKEKRIANLQDRINQRMADGENVSYDRAELKAHVFFLEHFAETFRVGDYGSKEKNNTQEEDGSKGHREDD